MLSPIVFVQVDSLRKFRDSNFEDGKWDLRAMKTRGDLIVNSIASPQKVTG